MVIDKNGRLFANSFEIVNLKRPFRTVNNKVKSKKSIKVFTRRPSETLSSQRMKSFGVEIQPGLYGYLYKIYPMNVFKCHAIYKTTPGMSKLFKVRSMSKMARKQVTSEVYTTFQFYLTRMLTLIHKSFPFDVVISDYPITSSPAPNIVADWSIIAPIPSRSDNIRVLSTLVGKYGAIPLSSCGSVLAEVEPMYTNCDLSVVENYNNVLVFSVTNGYYSGYLTKLLYERYPQKEVLPLVGFVF